MKRVSVLVALLCFLLFSPPASGAVKEVYRFFQTCTVGDVSIHGKGVITIHSPQLVEVAVTQPVEETFRVTGSRAELVIACIRGDANKMSAGGITVMVVNENPRTLWISLGYRISAKIILNGEDLPVFPNTNELFLGRFYESGRTLPFLMHVRDERVIMFSNLLFPFGWVDIKDGKAADTVRVVPDTAADALLKRLAEVINAGIPPLYQGKDWQFAFLPIEKREGRP
ncbi:MAG: hypothetical protein DELT_01964 [Desulfovibrio sp.]